MEFGQRPRLAVFKVVIRLFPPTLPSKFGQKGKKRRSWETSAPDSLSPFPGIVFLAFGLRKFPHQCPCSPQLQQPEMYHFPDLSCLPRYPEVCDALVTDLIVDPLFGLCFDLRAASSPHPPQMSSSNLVPRLVSSSVAHTSPTFTADVEQAGSDPL